MPTAVLSQEPVRYEADWASLDQRPTPQWWRDAKFGIFIHWGVYSVPAYAPKGEYAEWYWDRSGRAVTDDTPEWERPIIEEVHAFHDRVYGAQTDYADFAADFDASFFDAAQWAEMFAGAGAQYVVLVSKHHDGFALWPSAEASDNWGRPWNSAEIGPMRDIVGELTDAVRAEGLRMGIYFSLYEWFHPLYDPADPGAYVTQHMAPQLRDVVTRYEPEVIFADGEWEAPSADWRSEDLLAWLFNDSPVAGTVVVNDRWGEETRHKHGGYYTTEYGAGMPDSTHPWEENRGMGHSYGFNRNEELADYATDRELLLTLIDTVSRGGNLLLNVGPTADGRIPVIMQDRLAYIGTWLEHNGEAIFGTVTYGSGVQWTDGSQPQIDTDTIYRADYDVVELLVSPQPGQARKEVLYTRKGDTLYAIAPIYPVGALELSGVTVSDDVRVTLLGHDGTQLTATAYGDDLVIETPPVAPGELPFEGAFVFRIEGLAD
ncbi:alpha-L-fucosidase [Aquisalinus flavus]|nr:alpha-L-fucosidase [Aquisalinus flavus]UNE49206.1 alpha-L-fucosidase [Aquisalinus flavus]